MRNLIISGLLLAFLSVCESYPDNLPNPGSFSDTLEITGYPVNMYQVNSQFDDYNSYVGISFIENNKLIFSTNQPSNGNQFDLVSYDFWLITDASLPDTTTYYFFIGHDTLFIKNLLRINSGCDELGPYLSLINFHPDQYIPGNDSLLFFLTRECDGNADILFKKFHHPAYDSDYISGEDFRRPDILNSEYNDGYVSISYDFKRLFFCSDRYGDFDLFELTGLSGSNIYDILYSQSAFTINRPDNLNSNGDDKCPFADYNMLVFTSDREGGFGGFDLYYSKLIDQNWSHPVNFGSKINTPYDEYRPVIFNNSVMIFSSDRPGGRGGFDLYIVRL